MRHFALVPLLTVVAAFAMASKASPSHHVATTTASPATSCTPTIVFNFMCGHADFSNPNCWTPSRAVTDKDIVSFPEGSFVGHVPNTPTYVPVILRGLVVALGVNLRLHGQGWQVTRCMQIYGNVTLQGGLGPDGAAVGSYLPDPTQPEGTDCVKVAGGFTPRICGPGAIDVFGSLSVFGGASVFAPVNVHSGGLLYVQNSFLWGNVTVLKGGNSITNAYVHGNIAIEAGATMSLSAFFDIWGSSYVATHPRLRILNKGNLQMSADTQTKIMSIGVYPVLLVNYGDVTFAAAAFAGISFDTINYGTIMWTGVGQPFEDYQSNSNVWGTTINHGNMIANDTIVYMTSYTSDNGTQTQLNGGYFSMGYGAGVDVHAIKQCVPKKEQPSHKAAHAAFIRNAECSDVNACPSGHCCNKGRCEVARCALFCVDNNDVCDDYHGYGGFHEHQSCDKDVTLERLGESTLRYLTEKRVPVPRLQSQRYVFRGTSYILGDASSHCLSTEPLRVEGTLVINNGGQVMAMTEKDTPGVFGNGQVIVGRKGHLTVGIRSSFVDPVTIRVKAGGSVHVPRWSRVVFSNATMLVERDAVLHVDGSLLFQPVHKGAKLLSQCGTLRGRGTVGAQHDIEC